MVLVAQLPELNEITNGYSRGVAFLLEVKDMSNHTVSFESTQIGAEPEGWTATLTGKGDPKWTVEKDETATSKLKVVKQSGRATYPLLLRNDTNIRDGFIDVRFKAIEGFQDRALQRGPYGDGAGHGSPSSACG